VVLGDVRDPHAMRACVRDVEVVYHLAALIAIPYSYHAPDQYVDTNIKGTLNLLQAVRECDGVKLVHTSTSEVYGTAQSVPIDETHPLQAQSPYAATKIAADQLALSFYRSFDTPVAVVRPFNTYGPRQSLRAVIPTIITQLLAGRRKLRLGATHPTRDFSFVRDTAAGMLAVGERDKAIGEVINLGSGFEISISDTVALIAEQVGVAYELEVDAQRMRPAKSEVGRLFADTGKAQRCLGWTPAYGERDGFARGLRETIEWFQRPEHLAYYKPKQYTL